MDAIGISKYFYTALHLTPPDDEFVTTVTSAKGNQIVLASAPPAPYSGWDHCVLKVSVDDMPTLPSRHVIQKCNGNVITLFTSMDGTQTIPVGAEVSLVGGPLADSPVFLFEPPTVTQLVENNEKSWVVVVHLEQEVSVAGIRGSGRDNGANNSKRTHLLAITGEILDTYGSGSDKTAIELYDEKLAPYLLAEQILSVVHTARLNTCAGVYALEEIKSSSMNIFERDGSERTLVSVITFSASLIR